MGAVGSWTYAHHTAHGRQRRLVWAVRQQLESALICCRSCSALALRRHPYAHQIAYGHHEWQGATDAIALALRPHLYAHHIAHGHRMARAPWLAPIHASHCTRPSESPCVCDGRQLVGLLNCGRPCSAVALWLTPIRASHRTRPPELACACSMAMAPMLSDWLLLMLSSGATGALWLTLIRASYWTRP